MKRIHSNLKKGEMKLEVENLDDLWYLSQVIDPGDLISGTTLRKIKIGDEQSANVIRKPVFMQIRVEKIDFGSRSDTLRATGKITAGPDDVPLGTYHSFNIEEKTRFTLIKQRWLSFQIEKVDEAVKGDDVKILLVIFDREEAFFAMLKKYGYDMLADIKGSVQKKDREQAYKGGFYSEIIKKIKEYDLRYGFGKIVIGSPAFWKDELLKELKDDAIKDKIILATCSTVGKKGFDELLKREEVQHALKEQRVAKEIAIVEDLLREISKDGRAAYGIKEVSEAAQMGSIEHVMVTDSLIWRLREDGRYHELESILRRCDSLQGKVMIVSHEHEGGKKLDGLGGIGALLRYKI